LTQNTIGLNVALLGPVQVIKVHADKRQQAQQKHRQAADREMNRQPWDFIF
jgi:hypothetical protein